MTMSLLCSISSNYCRKSQIIGWLSPDLLKLCGEQVYCLYTVRIKKRFFVFKQKFYKKLKILEFSEKCQNLLFFITFENNLSTVKPLILNTSKEFMKCRIVNFSMGFILFYVNLSICENK